MRLFHQSGQVTGVGWDSVTADGPPATVTMKGTSLAFCAAIRQTKKSKAWNKYRLSGIAEEMAKNAGMRVMYEAGTNPYYKRIEQSKMSDIRFLSKLCHGAGISLKATADTLVLFDQRIYESKAAVRTIRRKDGSYGTYSMETGTADTQYASCRVSYSGGRRYIQGVYVDPELEKSMDKENRQQLEISQRVESQGEAMALAQKYLRLHNKYAKTASFTMAGDPTLAAGEVVELAGWGGWNGRYIIKQAQHTVGTGGYKTKITLRRCLGY